MTKCCVRGCNSNSRKNTETLSFFCFPKNEVLRKIWIQNIGEENIKPSAIVKICSKHFEPDSINRTLGVIRLKDDVVPTFFPMSEDKPLNKCSTSKDDAVSLGDEDTSLEHKIKTEEVNLEPDYVECNTDGDIEIKVKDEQTDKEDPLGISTHDISSLASVTDVHTNIETRKNITSQNNIGSQTTRGGSVRRAATVHDDVPLCSKFLELMEAMDCTKKEEEELVTSVTHREFRYALTECLVRRLPPRQGQISQDGDLMRLRRDIVHEPMYKSGSNNRKRCVVCSRETQRKLVNSQCITCGVFVCFESCWKIWHSSDTVKKRGQKRKREE